MKILVIDNYDSFTFNLCHYLALFCDNVHVYRNDEISLEDVNAYDAVVLSPGPGLPKDAGITKALVLKYFETKKILGVCLGHQAIAEVFGGRLKNLTQVLHGVSRTTYVKEPIDILYKEMPAEIACGRYHSWVVDSETIPEELVITAVDSDGEIMSFRHKSYHVRGVQFHPESVLTPYGKKIIENWLFA